MASIKTQPRDKAMNTHQLRKSGIIPAVLYGKSLDASVSVQLSESDVIHFLREHSVGAQVDMVLENDTYSAILKDVSRNPVTYNVQHLDFQVITADEKINTTAALHFINKDQLPDGSVFQEMLHEVHYTAKPRDFVESIEVDLAGLEIGDEIKVGDLAIAKNANIDISTPLDSSIVVISHAKVEVEEEAGEEEAASAEVPLVGEEE